MNSLPQMNPASPLDQLADIHLPPPVANFPWAPGWWVLLGLGLIALVASVIWLRKRRRNSAFRRAALLELAALNAAASDQEFAQQLNQLLRRVALHSFTKDDIAGLSGDKWMDFLYQSCGDKPAFSDTSLTALLAAAYQPSSDSLPRDVLIAESKSWIRRHWSRHV